MVAWRLLADARENAGLQEWKHEFLVAGVIIAAVLLVVAMLIHVVRLWRKRMAGRPMTNPGEQLTSFRALYERGELSREEYERIRAKLGQKLRKALEVPGPAAGPAATAEAPAEADSPPAPPAEGPRPPSGPPAPGVNGAS